MEPDQGAFNTELSISAFLFIFPNVENIVVHLRIQAPAVAWNVLNFYI